MTLLANDITVHGLRLLDHHVRSVDSHPEEGQEERGPIRYDKLSHRVVFEPAAMSTLLGKLAMPSDADELDGTLYSPYVTLMPFSPARNVLKASYDAQLGKDELVRKLEAAVHRLASEAMLEAVTDKQAMPWNDTAARVIYEDYSNVPLTLQAGVYVIAK